MRGVQEERLSSGVLGTDSDWLGFDTLVLCECFEWSSVCGDALLLLSGFVSSVASFTLISSSVGLSVGFSSSFVSPSLSLALVDEECEFEFDLELEPPFLTEPLTEEKMLW